METFRILYEEQMVGTLTISPEIIGRIKLDLNLKQLHGFIMDTKTYAIIPYGENRFAKH